MRRREPTESRSRSSASTRSGRLTGSARGTSGRTPTADGLTNARTRLVGARTGPLADAVVAAVRLAAAAKELTVRAAAAASTVITPLGWSTLVLLPLCFAAGYALAWTELVVIAWTLCGLLVAAGLYLMSRSALAVELSLPRFRVVAGDDAVGLIAVRNAGRGRSLGQTLEVPVDQGLAALSVPGLAPGERHELEFAVPAERRGIVSLGPARTVRADPIGFVRREVLWTGTQQLFVHPRTVPIPQLSTGMIRDLEGSPTRDLAASDVAFHSLREYVPGDERRHIHWKSTARTGRYMVRQFEETRRSHLVVALSLAEGDYADAEEFELAVEVAASLGIRAVRDGRDVAVLVGESTPEFAKRKVLEVRGLSTVSRSRLLDDFAAVERSRTALAVVDTAAVTAATVPAISVVFLVCGSTVTPTELRTAASRFPAGVHVVAVLCDRLTQPGYRRLSALTVYTIGYLEDLQKALARTVAA